MLLDGVTADEWIVFERCIITRDLFTGGGRTFLSTADATAFRSLVYQQYGKQQHADREHHHQQQQQHYMAACDTKGVSGIVWHIVPSLW